MLVQFLRPSNKGPGDSLCALSAYASKGVTLFGVSDGRMASHKFAATYLDPRPFGF